MNLTKSQKQEIKKIIDRKLSCRDAVFDDAFICDIISIVKQKYNNTRRCSMQQIRNIHDPTLDPQPRRLSKKRQADIEKDRAEARIAAKRLEKDQRLAAREERRAEVVKEGDLCIAASKPFIAYQSNDSTEAEKLFNAIIMSIKKCAEDPCDSLFQMEVQLEECAMNLVKACVRMEWARNALQELQSHPVTTFRPVLQSGGSEQMKKPAFGDRVDADRSRNNATALSGGSYGAYRAMVRRSNTVKRNASELVSVANEFIKRRCGTTDNSDDIIPSSSVDDTISIKELECSIEDGFKELTNQLQRRHDLLVLQNRQQRDASAITLASVPAGNRCCVDGLCDW